MDSFSLITETFAPLEGKTILDIGCGHGLLVKTLVAHGANATGIDPSVAAIEAARTNIATARFEAAAAERLPFDDATFDGVIFLNSLHHIEGLETALREAARVVKRTGGVVVIEPTASGSFFAALRPVDDETTIRAAAQEAIQRAVSTGTFRLVRTEEFNRRESFDGFHAFRQRISAADPVRECIIRERMDIFQAAFEASAGRDKAGHFILDQPLRAHVLMH